MRAPLRGIGEEPVIAILWEQEAGARTADLCRRHGISSATVYARRARCGGMEPSDARRLKALKASRSDGHGVSNARLKRLHADVMLDNAGLNDLLAKKW